MRVPATAHALSGRQYKAFKKLVRDSNDIERDVATVEPVDRSRSSLARLMTIGAGVYPDAELPDPDSDYIEVEKLDQLPATGQIGRLYLVTETLQTFRFTQSGYLPIELPIYNTLRSRPAVLFDLSRRTLQGTIQFLGEDLWGDVTLKIGDDVEARIDCRATTEQLRSALQQEGFDLDRCRVTAFPGLWEFAFADDVAALPAVTCEPVITSTRPFLGGCLVTREGWRSVSADGDTPSLVQVIDCIPHLEGEVKLGSMALAHRLGANLYMAGQWSCPGFTFRSI